MILNPFKQIASALNISEHQVSETLKLFAEKATIPFIARYRKEVTGGLDEVEIGKIKSQYDAILEIEARRESILTSIEKQGKLTPELKAEIEKANSLIDLEDIYLPYKIKKNSKSMLAKAHGLEPLAEIVFKQENIDLKITAEKFINENVATVDDALHGARDIIAEWINENIDARENIRQLFDSSAIIKSKVKKIKQEEATKFKDYFDCEELLRDCPSHRLLAMRRGETEGFLQVSIAPLESDALRILNKRFVTNKNECGQQVELAIEDCYKRLLKPSLENEFAKLSKDQADAQAIEVFTNNLKQLLLAAPLGQKRVMGLDPGFRTGCKLVCLDDQGNLLFNTVIYPETNSSDAQRVVSGLVEKLKIEAIAIGNGTAGRETEDFIRKLKLKADIFVVSESGASVYSASEIARQEFPDKDITVRGAVSIARRLMDPLAELVKIDPKAIGVGQYQHDVDQKKLKDSLDITVEICVNQVGVNLNTASQHLLTYVSGLGPTLAQNIIELRKEKGMFKTRAELKKVKKLGPKAFEQCAGFLRIKDAKNPLDNSAVHPESYKIVEQMADDLNTTVKNLIGNTDLIKKISLQKYLDDKVGMPTLRDILAELEKPGLDPRGAVEIFQFEEGIHTIEDLEVGMKLPGIVTNVTNFGAFVDIGVHCDGLIHVSQMADYYVSNPAEILSLQQKVMAKVIEIDIPRKRISLSLKNVD